VNFILAQQQQKVLLRERGGESMENEAVVSVDLTLSEIKLIRELIGNCHLVFTSDVMLTKYGKTHVEVKMLEAGEKFR
jgi:hypothetical protein